MRNRHHRGFAVTLAALGLAALMLSPLLSVAWPVPKALAAGAADAQARELVRLINGERAYLGKSTLGTDSYLAAKARDGAITCPSDAALVMAGRAKDMAAYDRLSHTLRLCTQYSALDAMKTWGYRGSRGEIIAVNGGYGTAKVAYAYGCSPSVATCPGPETSSYATSARAMTNWIHSSGHYSIIVGGYDRVGCGAWIGPNGAYYYACLFSLGGRAAVATPRPAGKAAPQPGATATPGPAVEATTLAPTQPPPWPTPSGASAWIATPQPTAVAGAADRSDAGLPPATGWPLGTGLTLAAGGLATAGALVFLLGPVRRRRRAADDA